MGRRIKIDKGIPIPGRRGSIYPFDKMKVGDSFFIKLKPRQTKRQLQVMLAGKANYYAKCSKNKAKFRTYRDDRGVRIWRVK